MRRIHQRRARRDGLTLKSAALWSVAGIAFFLLLDGALFHSGFYNPWVEPNSSAGEVEGHLHWLEEAPVHKHEVLLIGDSRVAEGFSAPQATAAAEKRLHFVNFGVPGSFPRVWYYMIRDADPDADRFDAIVIALGQYSDQDLSKDLQDVSTDLNYLAGRLRYTDCLALAHSYLSTDPARNAFTGCVFRGSALRRDAQALLHSPADRLKRAADWMAHGQGYIDGYNGKPESVAGLSADFQNGTLVFPPGLNASQMGSIRATVFPADAPQTGLLTRYREEWLGAIVDRYSGSRTRVVFAELPRAPLPVPEAKTPPRFLQRIAKRPNVSVLPADTFRDLERPDLFADGLHLNHEGRPIFSTRMGERVSDLLDTH